MKRIFRCKVTNFGEEALDMLALRSFVIFSEEALNLYDSDELKSICVMHDFPKSPYYKVTPGSVLRLGEAEYPIVAVGEAANHNLKNYGHVTFQLLKEGEERTLKHGDIHVLCPQTPRLELDMPIEILRDF